MSIAVILNAHENSYVFHDTLESISHYLTKDILVVVDGVSWNQFENAEIQALKMSGFPHGKKSAPFRNMALGLFKAWQTWGDTKKWYCYLEYDCVVGSSSELIDHLKKAEEFNFWLLGNDLRQENKKIPFIENFLKQQVPFLNYFLGCCLFFNSDFLQKLSDENFFENFLSYTNFYQDVYFEDKKEIVYDVSEFLYPTLATYYGGEIRELASWTEESSTWSGNAEFYPMRFRPDLTLADPYVQACILHPLKSFENPVRQYHRGKRHGQVLTSP